MFNFPASPSNGQTYEPVNGPVFTWDGTAWKALSQGMPVTVFVADAPPAAPSFGNLWWESDTGNLYIYYNDGDSAQWVQINGTPAGYQTADSRNRIVNGAMQISQENGGTGGTTNQYYPADQWYMGFGASGGVASAQQIPSSSYPTPSRIRVVCITAKTSLAAGDSVGLIQRIEGINLSDFRWGTAYAKPAVLRFDASSELGGTFTVFIRDSTDSVSYLANFTLPAGLLSPQTVVVPIPVPAIGTWNTDTSRGASIGFSFASGTTYTSSAVNTWLSGLFASGPGASNGMATVNQSLNIWNVGLYLDPDNTGVAPKWQMPDEAEELRACQRYYETSYPPDVKPGTILSGGHSFQTAGTSTLGAMAARPFQTVKRTTPTMVIYSSTSGASGKMRSMSGGGDVSVDSSSAIATGLASITFSAAPTAAYQYQFHFVANARM